MNKQPYIAIVPRLGNDFSIEVRHDDEGNWETYYNGSCINNASQFLNLALKHYPSYAVYPVDWDAQDPCPMNGYVYKVRNVEDELKNRAFYKAEVRDPFLNRRTYQASMRDKVISFSMVGKGMTDA